MNKIEKLESLCTDLYEDEKCIYYKRMKKLGLLSDTKNSFEVFK